MDALFAPIASINLGSNGQTSPQHAAAGSAGDRRAVGFSGPVQAFSDSKTETEDTAFLEDGEEPVQRWHAYNSTRTMCAATVLGVVTAAVLLFVSAGVAGARYPASSASLAPDAESLRHSLLAQSVAEEHFARERFHQLWAVGVEHGTHAEAGAAAALDGTAAGPVAAPGGGTTLADALLQARARAAAAADATDRGLLLAPPGAAADSLLGTGFLQRLRGSAAYEEPAAAAALQAEVATALERLGQAATDSVFDACFGGDANAHAAHTPCHQVSGFLLARVLPLSAQTEEAPLAGPDGAFDPTDAVNAERHKAALHATVTLLTDGAGVASAAALRAAAAAARPSAAVRRSPEWQAALAAAATGGAGGTGQADVDAAVAAAEAFEASTRVSGRGAEAARSRVREFDKGYQAGASRLVVLGLFLCAVLALALMELEHLRQDQAYRSRLRTEFVNAEETSQVIQRYCEKLCEWDLSDGPQPPPFARQTRGGSGGGGGSGATPTPTSSRSPALQGLCASPSVETYALFLPLRQSTAMTPNAEGQVKELSITVPEMPTPGGAAGAGAGPGSPTAVATAAASSAAESRASHEVNEIEKHLVHAVKVLRLLQPFLPLWVYADGRDNDPNFTYPEAEAGRRRQKMPVGERGPAATAGGGGGGGSPRGSTHSRASHAKKTNLGGSFSCHSRSTGSQSLAQSFTGDTFVPVCSATKLKLNDSLCRDPHESTLVLVSLRGLYGALFSDAAETDPQLQSPPPPPPPSASSATDPASDPRWAERAGAVVAALLRTALRYCELRHGGVLLDLTPNGLLFRFRTSVAACLAATELQRQWGGGGGSGGGALGALSATGASVSATEHTATLRNASDRGTTYGSRAGARLSPSRHVSTCATGATQGGCGSSEEAGPPALTSGIVRGLFSTGMVSTGTFKAHMMLGRCGHLLLQVERLSSVVGATTLCCARVAKVLQEEQCGLQATPCGILPARDDGDATVPATASMASRPASASRPTSPGLPPTGSPGLSTKASPTFATTNVTPAGSPLEAPPPVARRQSVRRVSTHRRSRAGVAANQRFQIVFSVEPTSAGAATAAGSPAGSGQLSGLEHPAASVGELRRVAAEGARREDVGKVFGCIEDRDYFGAHEALMRYIRAHETPEPEDGVSEAVDSLSESQLVPRSRLTQHLATQLGFASG